MKRLKSELFVRDTISCIQHSIYAFMYFPDFVNCVYGDNQKQLLFVGGLFDGLMVFDLAELSEPHQLRCLLDVERTGKVIEIICKWEANAINPEGTAQRNCDSLFLMHAFFPVRCAAFGRRRSLGLLRIV